MTKMEIEKSALAAQLEAESEVDQTLERVEQVGRKQSLFLGDNIISFNIWQIEGVLRRPSHDSLPSSSGSAAAGRLIHTAKAERPLRERMEREGVNEDDADDNDDSSEAMSPAEKRALDAEKRAAWRKARLKSLENVRGLMWFLFDGILF